MDEICMVLLARACGNGVLGQILLKSRFGGSKKPLKLYEIRLKSENLHEMGREKTCLNFEESMQFFSANFTVIVVSGQTLLKN